MHRDGYGFVVPNPGQRGTIEGDIFIPPPAIGSAMHGDQVLVELGRKKEDGRAEGRILRVLTRGNPTVVGTFHRGSKQNYVTPIDEKVQQDIVIPAGWSGPPGDEAPDECRIRNAPFNPSSVERETSRKPRVPQHPGAPF